IAEIVASLNGRVGDECVYISIMAEATKKMVTGSIDAYVKEDVKLAEAVLRHDDLVDETFMQVKETLINMIAENVDDGEYALDLLMIAKYFERIGDHATNIAEWVIFSVTGYHKGE
ncbi:MAG: PhoU domain-containing protein, partial [Erysipelotrichaceae bacterium]